MRKEQKRMELGDKIKMYRQFRGLTQKELGMAAGFKESTADVRINQYETGKMYPKENILQRLADALDIDVSLLNKNNLSEDVLVSILELQQVLHFDISIVNDQVIFSFPKLPENDEFYKSMKVLSDKNREIGSISLLYAHNNAEEYEKWKIEFLKHLHKGHIDKIDSRK